MCRGWHAEDIRAVEIGLLVACPYIERRVVSDEPTDIFVRQRRNLMAMSLVLLVADVQNDIHMGPVALHVHAPFTITLILWVVWSYWLWRYYTSFHDLGDKGFRNKYRQRLQVLVEQIGVKRICQGDRAEFKEIHANFQKTNSSGTRTPIAFNSSYAKYKRTPWRIVLAINFGVKDLDGILGVEELKPTQNVVVDGIQFLFAAARAWAYVIFRTTLFSEYILPFAFAAVTLAYGLYVRAFPSAN
jgi:hypothetical protein